MRRSAGSRPRTSGAATGSAAPRLVARTAAPRLGTPLTAPARAVPRSGYFTSGRYRYGSIGRVGFGSVWCGWWNNNNWYRPWSNCWGWSLGWGFGGYNPYWWNFALNSPYWAYQTSFWNSCYRTSYWNGWSRPGYVGGSYWWYPSSTYCPTFLTVPSSVVVVDDGWVDGGAGGSTTTILVGSGAGAGDAGAGAAADSEPLALASKYVELGDFYFQAGRYEDAAEAYAKARSYAPQDASVHFVLADAVFANGDYHYAAFLIAEAVRLDPAIVSADTDKRLFYGTPLDFEHQMEALQRYVTEKPFDAWAQLVLAYNLRFSEEPARAQEAFRRVLELDRGNPTAQAFLNDLLARAEAGAAVK